MLESPRGAYKELLRKQMYEDYHTYYLELKRYRRLSTEEFQMELAMMDQVDAW